MQLFKSCLLLHMSHRSVFKGTIVSIGDPKKKYTRYEKIGQGWVQICALGMFAATVSCIFHVTRYLRLTVGSLSYCLSDNASSLMTYIQKSADKWSRTRKWGFFKCVWSNCQNIMMFWYLITRYLIIWYLITSCYQICDINMSDMPVLYQKCWLFYKNDC